MPFRSLFLVSCFLFIVTTLSACSAIGTNRPSALQVTTKPEASVFLDGKHLGKTPFYSDQLKAGTHTIKITAQDATYVDQIELVENTLTVLERDLANDFQAQSGQILSLQPGKKGLFVISQPQDAQLTVDGKFIANTPKLVTELEDGDHKIQVSKAGYQTREFAVKTAGNSQLVADVTLALEAAKSIASGISSQPAIQTIARIEVIQTPQGFLRVRQDASTNSPEIGRVKTGDKLEVIQETIGWIKVNFEGKQGWISADYTKKVM